MSTLFNRTVFFDSVRENVFNGRLTQQQVDGLNSLLDVWEKHFSTRDLRWLAYCLGTTMHETASTCWPVEEYGKGKGMKYGVPDPETGQTYYGRGDVQITWRENYARADRELGLIGEDSCEWHAENQLRPNIAAATLYRGMIEGWFRTHNDGKPETLERYFNATRDDPYGAREIVNGDKHKVPSWSHGVSIGNLIMGYHENFLIALNSAVTVEEEIPPVTEPPTAEAGVVAIAIETTGNTTVTITINGKVVQWRS